VRLRLTLLGAALLAGAAAPPAQAQPPPRLNVYILGYPSSQGGDRRDFMAQVTQDRLSLLSSEVRAAAPQADYLRGLTVRTDTAATPASDAALAARWARPGTLALMWGTVQPGTRDGRDFLIATSSVYVGTAPADKLEVLRTDLLARNHMQLRDSHSFAAGYALLLEARRTGKPRAVQFALLASLNNRYLQIARSGHMTDDVRQVKASIDQIARQLAAPP
jgi:hypothetical protein